MTTLVNTLISEKGELLTVGHGRRLPLAHCRPEIRVYEKVSQVPVLGAAGYREKSMWMTIALCGDMKFTRHVTAEDIREVERYELTADLMRGDGIVERFYFHNIFPREISMEDEWEFTLQATKEQMEKLLTMAGIQKGGRHYGEDR